MTQSIYDLRKFVGNHKHPECIKQMSGRLVKQCVTKGLLKGRSIEGMVTACHYYAIRYYMYPSSLDELCEHLDTPKKKVWKYYKLIKAEFNLREPPPNPIQFLDNFISELGLAKGLEDKSIWEKQKFRRYSLNLLQQISGMFFIIGKDPKAVTCAVLYIIGKKYNYPVNQRRLSEISTMTEATIRARIKDIRKKVITGDLKIP